MRTIPLSDLVPSDRDRTSYAFRSTPGGPLSDPELEPAGTSIKNLLTTELALPVESVQEVAVQRPGNAGQVRLSGDQLGSVGDPGYPFRDGPPVFFSRGDGGLTFLRPLQAQGDQDVNTSDRFDGPSLAMTVTTTGRVLHPTLTADRTEVKPGEPVQLTVAGYGDATDFAWDFQNGDRTRTDGPTISHSWDSVSTYDAVVTVQSDGGVGVASVRIKVGGGGTDGPPGGGGGSDDGPTTGGPGQGQQAGGVPGKGGAGQGGRGPRGTGSQGPGGTAAAGAAPTTTSSGGAPGSTTDRAAADRQRGRQDQQPVADGARVNGILLDAALARAVPQPTGSSPKVASATTREATDLPTDWRWLLAGVPVLLLALGSATRSRWLTGRLPEPPWRSS